MQLCCLFNLVCHTLCGQYHTFTSDSRCFSCELSSSVSVPVDGPCLLPPSCLTISRILYIFVSSLLSFFICIPAIIFRINILSIDDITMMKGDGIREGPELFLESSKDSLNVLSESIVLCHKNIVKSCCFVSL